MLTDLRNWCRSDLYFLLRYGCARRDVEQPWIFERCREVQAEPNGYLDLWSREHYKSTIITFGLTILEVLASHGADALITRKGAGGKDEPAELCFGIFSHTRPAAKAFLKQIKVEFESNPRLKYWFPDVLYADPKSESTKWSEDEGICVKRTSNPKEQTVEAWGLVDGQPTGKHFPRMIYDDVVTKDSVTTPEMIKKTTEGWELSRALGAGEDFVSRYPGTRYHTLDTYSVMIKRGVKPRIHTLYPTDAKGRQLGPPVLRSEQWVKLKRLEMGRMFNPQMLQNPVPADDAFFNVEEWPCYYTGKPPEHLSKYGASDFATTEAGGDYTVHVVAGVDPDDNLYILDLWRGQATTDVWIDEMVRLCREQKTIYQWGVPRDQIKRSIGPFLTKRLRETKTYISIEELPDAGKKPEKAQSFRGRMAMRKVYFPINATWWEDCKLELSMFPVGHDDQVDAFGVLGRMLDLMVAGTVPVESEESTLPQRAKNDYAPIDTSDDIEEWKAA